jgi:myosin heavy subunit
MDYNQEQKQDRKTLLWAALAVLALLNLVLVYFIYHEKQENATKDQIITAKTEEVLFTKTKLDSISTELDLKIAEIQQLGGSVDSLVALKSQLERDKVALRNMNSFSAASYDKKIKSYESILNKNDQEILRLKEELGIATSKNEELSQRLTGLESEKQQLADSVINYSVQNKELNEKVNIASALRAENITIHAVSAKGKEREGERFKAKRIDKLKVSFRLGDNAVAKKNEKEFTCGFLTRTGPFFPIWRRVRGLLLLAEKK